MISVERLKQVLEYDPETGIWTWLVSPCHFIKVGQVAGHVQDNGYRQIRIDYVYYKSARLAHLYMTGEWPKEQMDHINRDRADDRWVNLREATASDNNVNKRLQCNNTSGYRGVSWDRWQQKWNVRVNRMHLGWYDNLATAVAERDRYALLAQGSFAILNSQMEISR